MEPFIRKLSQILVIRRTAILLVTILVSLLSILPANNVVAQDCDEGWWGLWGFQIKGKEPGTEPVCVPGEVLNCSIHFELSNPSNCRVCRQQILVGIDNVEGKPISVGSCLYDGIPAVCPDKTARDSNFAVTAPDTPGQYRIVIVHCYLESCTEAKNSFFHGYEKGPVGENALITISVTDSKLDKESVAPTTPPLPTPTKEDTTTGSSESGTTQDGGSPTIGSNILLIIIVIALLVLLFIFSLMGPKAVKRFFRFILVLAVVSFLGYLFWTYGIPVIMPWFRQNISTIIGVLLSLVVIAIAGTAVWINRHKISNWIKEKLGITGPSSEITHINRGVSISSPVLGQAVSETEEPDVELLCNKIIDRINSFSVPSQGQNELFYHLQLFQWLKSQFPDTEYEKTIGDSRIDIAIQKIAIEVKGPTYDSDLEDLKYKPKYLSLKNNYFKRLICVLFEKHYTDTKYEKITEPLKQLHGRKVIFIQK